MPNRLVVGMVTQDSPFAQNLPDSVDARLGQLRAAIDDFANFGQQPPAAPPPLAAPGAPPPPPPPMANSTLRIFLAPEYFFRKRVEQARAARSTTAYSEAEMARIRGAMLAFSLRFTNFLLIGGSVLWHDTARGGVFIRHSLFVCHKGNLLLHYEKKNDCSELQKFETVPVQPYVFQPGNTLGRFTVDGLNCGLETCIDHDLGQLRSDNVTDLDLHFVVSNTVTIKQRNVMAHPHGYVLHANAGPFGAGAYRDPFDLNARIAGGTPGCVVSQQSTRGRFVLPWPAVPDQTPRGGLRIV